MLPSVGRMNALDIRPVTPSEFADWLRALNTGFLRQPTPPEEEVTGRLPYMDLARTRGRSMPGGAWRRSVRSPRS